MMCRKTTLAILLLSAFFQASAPADELIGFSDVTVENGAIISLRFEGVEYVVADGDLLLGTTTRWYVDAGTEVLWEEGGPLAPTTVPGTSNPKGGDVGSKGDNFLFTLNGSTNISSIDGIDFQQTIFPVLNNIFFHFERGGNDTGTWQAINADGSLGPVVPFTAANVYQNTNVNVNGQNAFGVVFKTDKLVMGLRISAGGHDTFSISTPVPDQISAAFPSPEDAAVDAARDATLSWMPGIHAATHNVYLSTSWDDANDATAADSLGAEVAIALDVNSVDVGRLDFGQTYYWRVDEVNAAPDSTVFKGAVWSFTVEPFSISISDISATASSSFGTSGPEKTIDGSGLVDDLHNSSAADMWISAGIPATLEYAFEKVYKMHELWIWNSNQLIESFVGFGAKDVVIEHSLDGENWTVLDGVGPLAPGPGTPGYAHNNTIDFGGAAARHVRVTVNSVQGIAPQASLSELRFFFIPTAATRPSPESGASAVSPDVTLSWGRDGREADHHEIYLGTDAADLQLAGRVNQSSFDTLDADLQLGQTYHWRVDEVNEAMDPSVWSSEPWSFTTTSTILIDDMESYADAEFLEIWATWIDGFDDPANGSLVGADPAIGDFAPETGIVHGGSQSLPIWFDNGAAALSEATRTFDQTQDWSRSGVQTLVLSFLIGGDSTGNGQLYVKINGTKVVHPQDPGALPPGLDMWTQWNIDLAGLGVNLTRIGSLTVGMEGAGAKGVLYVDDIHLLGGSQ